MPYGSAAIDTIESSGNLAITGNVTATGSLTANGISTPTVTDSLWKYRMIRLDFEGTNNDAITYNYVGSSPVGLQNAAVISNTQAKFGTTSMSVSGASSGLQQCVIPLTTPIGTQNLTIEGWIYPTSFTNNSFPGIFDLYNTTTSRIGLYFGSATTVVLRLNSTNNSYTLSTIGISLNTWTHIALERVSGTLNFYVNGVSQASLAYTTSIDSSWTMNIGATGDGYPMQGFIDDFRLTVGRTVYGANFTPSTSALPVSPYNMPGLGVFGL